MMLLGRLSGLRDALRLSLLVGGLLLAAHLAGCADPVSGNDCDCDAGYVCGDRGECLKVCARTSDCRNATETCVNDVCRANPNPECTANAECNSPKPCEQPAGTCSGGTCRYNAVTCNTPPATECTADNAAVRQYGTSGVCDPGTGDCAYSFSDAPCTNFISTCLGSGRCVPGAPPTCVCAKPNGAACTNNEECLGTCITNTCSSPHGNNGICDFNDSDDCTSDLTCSGTSCLKNDGATCSGNTECVHVCINGLCAPAAAAGQTCDANDDADCSSFRCRGGICVLGDGGTCSTNEQCENTCINLRCAPLSAARGACDPDDSADCVSSASCIGTTCLVADGGACANNSDCINTCIGPTCQARAGTGGTCDGSDSADCQPNRTCVSSKCLLDNGQTCTNNVDCVNTCLGPTCANRSAASGTCDTSDTADCEAGLICSGTTCVAGAGSCSCSACGAYPSCSRSVVNNCGFGHSPSASCTCFNDGYGNCVEAANSCTCVPDPGTCSCTGCGAPPCGSSVNDSCNAGFSPSASCTCYEDSYGLCQIISNSCSCVPN